MSKFTMRKDIEHLPVMYFNSVKEIEALPEYSCTMPTGVIPGKMWRRHDGSFDPKCKDPVWLIGKYVEAPRGKVRMGDPEGKVAWVWVEVDMCETVWFRPVVRVKARTPFELEGFDMLAFVELRNGSKY